MKSCELVTYVTAIACFISETSCEEELPVICAMLIQLCDTLRTMLAHQIFCNIEADNLLKEEEEAVNKIFTKIENEGNTENDSNNTSDSGTQATSKISKELH